MLFNSGAFLIFFPLVTAGYFVLPHRYRWLLLLVASCVFYMYLIPLYILILIFTIVVDYSAGILIEHAEGVRRKVYLSASLVANIGTLAVFKYADFVNDNVRTLATAIHWNYPIQNLGWILPVGLSFHTFQAMSYTFEVYYRRQRAERHFGIYALYVLFYPQLVAGPIERPQNLLHQFREEHRFDTVQVLAGLQQMLWGFFKKIVIADRLAIYSDLIFNNPSQYGGGDLLVATYCFAIQIYCDFSGYSDIAIGAARVMGFTLMTNFRRPYLAESVREFWQRWHISLSTWFRDYVYVPLGGSRVSQERWYRNILITFLLSGLWHGANWVFIVWGLLHGTYIVLGVQLAGVRARVAQLVGFDRLPAVLISACRIAITFHLVLIAWIFFRGNSLADCFVILRGLAAFVGSGLQPLAVTVLPVHDLAFLAAIIAAAALHNRLSVSRRSEFVSMASLAVQFWVIVVFGAFNNRQFIYFQF
jgi:D-alanyl-lipoteichoic acid acyltransferase DltB (MBOAT superfamily)